MRDALALALAFLCGSVPFGLLLVRLTRGIDVRSVGSGNIGATNASRAAGPAVGAAVLVLDALKGAVGVLAGRALAGPDAAPWTIGLLVLAATAGHVFTPWLRFKGGKGVATVLGALGVADWRLLLVALAVFLLVFAVSRTVSLGSVCAAAGVALAGFLLGGAAPPAWGVGATAALIVLRHRENLARLARGTEPRFGGHR